MDRHKELHEENELYRKQLEVILSMFIGCKWYDIGPLAWLQPEGEKYVTRESLMEAINREITCPKFTKG